MNTVLLLIAEDDPIQLMSLEDGLRDAGYQFLAAGNAKGAMTAIDSNSGILRGVVTDIQLGKGLQGWDVARHARSLIPDIPVVYMTGDSAHEWTVHGVPNSILINKPFAIAQLVTAISQLLNNTPTSEG